MSKRIDSAELDWGAAADTGGGPRSFLFDDIYFSGDGPAESNHVFLAANDLPARFENTRHFTIGELGFGTGLNFLTAWTAWSHAEKPDGARLRFLSVEKYPLSANDIARAHTAWPALGDLSARLRSALPPAHSGVHQINIADNVTLTLLHGDALEMLQRADASVDAWFLDGFSPAKNPEMWRPELMKEMARLSAPGATLATFTVAGAVKRALSDAGFGVEKRTGFGRKREMLKGVLEGVVETKPAHAPWFDTRRKTPIDCKARIAIIGAGIAGAALAHAMRREGYAPVIYEADAPAQGASGNPGGLIMPRLDADDTPAGRFHAAAYLHTVRLLNGLPDKIYNPCGVRRLATTDRERDRQKKLAGALPDGWMTAGDNAIAFPQGGVVDPAAFVAALIADTPVVTARVITIDKREGGGWRLKTTTGIHECDAAIIANALDAKWFVQMRWAPLTGSAGQIDWFPDAQAPDSAVAFGPYIAPCPAGGTIIGATYAPASVGVIPRFSTEATETTLGAIAKVLPAEIKNLRPGDSRPRVSVRCTTPDRLPVIGPVPDWGYYAGAYDGLRTGLKRDYPSGETLDGLYVLTGLGSRGLVTAPLCAAMIAADIAGAPAPVTADIAQAVHPARFYIRDLKRNR